MDKKEYNKIVYDWNKTEAVYPEDKTIHQLFEEQVKKTPDNIAVVFEDQKLTYRELNEKANQLAHTIREKYYALWKVEVREDTLIGIYIDRSIEMIIGILGILKSGAAYVPFDTADPEERLSFKINDCACKMVLTSSASGCVKDLLFLVHADTLPLAIDFYWNEIEKAHRVNPEPVNKSTDLAYVIYTSGSTGNPKGVMIEHQGVCNLARCVIDRFNISGGTKVLQFAPICFDASVYEWIGTITSGGQLIIPSENELPPNLDVSEVLYQKRINVAMLPPSVISTMAARKLPDLFTLVSGAEVCPQKAVDKWGNGRLFINAYGPTEITVAASMSDCKPGSKPDIGKPIQNKTFYVLDSCMKPVPTGVTGELYIGGDGLARGYLDRPELTKERFLENPFATNEDKAKSRNLGIYKTGDLAKWLPGGNLEFIGRNDDQVKIRGFRVELGEIEARLSEHPDINQCVVLAKEHNVNKYLVAYYTIQASGYGLQAPDRLQAPGSGLQTTGKQRDLQDPSVSVRVRPCQSVSLQSDKSDKHGLTRTNTDEHRLTRTSMDKYRGSNHDNRQHSTSNIQHLEDFLSEKLPSYMVPSHFIKMDEFFLNTSGKIDRKVLPDPIIKGDESNYEAPRNEQERKMCELWQETLGVEKIGINDDFFSLGGNSIFAIKVSHQMAKALNREIPLQAVFLKKNIKALLKSINEFKNLSAIKKCKRKNVPLSFAQKRLWYLHQHGAANAYKTPILLDLGEDVNLLSFKKAIIKIVERHEILRTIFLVDKDGNYYQEPQGKALEIAEFYCSTEKEFLAKLKRSFTYSFDLTREYPLRAEIYKAGTKYYAFLDFHHIAIDGWSLNVLFYELEFLYKKYAQEYPYFGKHNVPFEAKQKPVSLSGTKNGSCSVYLSKSDKTLPELRIQYKDFAVWQRKQLADVGQDQLDYWKNKLSGFEELNFPADFSRPSVIDYSGRNYNFEIDLNTSLSLQRLAKSKGTTLYNILLSAFYILLNKYTDQNDITIGVLNANRHYPQVDRLIGFFVNTIARRSIIEEDLTIDELINSVISESIEMQSYIDVPFEHVVNALEIERDTSRHPLFNIAFVAQNFGSNLEAFRSVEIEEYSKFALFDFALFIDDNPRENEINGHFNYSTSLFKEESIARLAKHYINVLNILAKNSDMQLDKLNMLSEDECQQIVYDWNKTEAPYPKDKTIHQLFEEQAEKTPDNIAVVFEDQRLTYRELNEKANQLGHTIREKYYEIWKEEVKSDTLIGIYMDRSIEIVIGILGILKSGAAYVPFDTADPEERLAFKINDSACKMVLTSSASGCVKDLLFLIHADTLPLAIDSYWDAIKKAPRENPEHINNPTDLAYIIYTSGSTGRPKGVMVEHKTIANLINHQSEVAGIDFSNNVLQLASCNFDVSVQEIFSTLFAGGPLHVVPQHLKQNISNLLSYIKRKEITTLFLPPALLQLIFSEDNKISFGKRPLCIIAAGEQLVINELLKKNISDKKIILYNHYGPTESHVVTNFLLDKNSKLLEHPPIGRAISNIALYILNAGMQPVPIGATGELYIGGDGLARGYLDRPELTQERFLANPFATDEDKAKDRNRRLYKTGDIVRWLPDGNLEFMGRNDDQIKIRGFRVELGEIESKLQEHPVIKQCAVLCKEHNKNKYLAAYYTIQASGSRLQASDKEHQASGSGLQASDNGPCQTVSDQSDKSDKSDVLRQTRTNTDGHGLTRTNMEKDTRVSPKNIQHPTPNTQHLAAFLSKKLPDYMVPSHFIKLGEFPLNTSGKINKKALPDPELKGDDEDNYVAPRNKKESKLCRIWGEVLGISRVGINNDFFKIGGNSILALQLIFKMNKVLKSDLKVAQLFANSTINKLSFEIEKSYTPIVKFNEQARDLPNIFMIHSGLGGCEVYKKLPDNLKNRFNCFGIDNYNLYQRNKIENLPELAKYYLDFIKQKIKPGKPNYFLGWCLGGLIAMEIALLLEKENINNINVILINSVLEDSCLVNEKHKANISQKFKVFESHLIGKGYETGYVKKSIDALLPAVKLTSYIPSQDIKYSKVLLFKALQPDPLFGNTKSTNHILNLPYNNVDKYICGKNLKKIELDCHHYNILENNESIASNIIKWMSCPDIGCHINYLNSGGL